MSNAFLHSVVYKYQLFAIDSQHDIWRVWFDVDFPLMQKLVGNEAEYYTVKRLLKAQIALYYTPW